MRVCVGLSSSLHLSICWSRVRCIRSSIKKNSPWYMDALPRIQIMFSWDNIRRQRASISKSLIPDGLSSSERSALIFLITGRSVLSFSNFSKRTSKDSLLFSNFRSIRLMEVISLISQKPPDPRRASLNSKSVEEEMKVKSNTDVKYTSLHHATR